MYIYSRYVIQYGSVLILYLTGSISITAVILIGITVYYDLGGGGYDRSHLGRLNISGLNLSGLNISLVYIRRCTRHNRTVGCRRT